MDPPLLNLPDHVETERLIIRPPRAGDGAPLYRAIVESLAELRRWPLSLGWAVGEQSAETSEAYAQEAAAAFQARRDFPMLLTLRQGGAIVGSSGLHRPDWAARSFEIGWWGHTPSTGRGLVTEGVRAVLTFAFDELGAARVEALPEEANARSCALCERVGMGWDGRHRAGPLTAADGVGAIMRVYAIERRREAVDPGA